MRERTRTGTLKIAPAYTVCMHGNDRPMPGGRLIAIPQSKKLCESGDT